MKEHDRGAGAGLGASRPRGITRGSYESNAYVSAAKLYDFTPEIGLMRVL